MKKVALLITNLGQGGAEKWVANVSDLLTQAALEVHVFILENKVEQKLNEKTFLHVVQPEIKVSGSWFYRFKTSHRLRKVVEQHGPFDLIISTLPFCDTMTKASGLSSVYYRIANTLSEEIKSLSKVKSKRRFKRYLNLYQKENLILVSDGVKFDMEKNFHCSPEKMTRIYNPLNFQKINELSNEKIERSNEDYILYAGRFAKQKRIDVLLDTWFLFMKQNPAHEVKTLLMLTEANEELKHLIHERKLEKHVKVLGFHKNPYPWIKSARCLMLSSDREGMPNVLIEAMALGTPVASTNCPSGPQELLGEKLNECLAECGKPESLCKALEYALKLENQDFSEVLKPFEAKTVIDQIMSLT